MRCSTKNHDDASAPVCVDAEFLASRVVNTFRADVAKECLAALVAGGDILNGLPYDVVADIAVRSADALIARLQGGPP